MLKGCMVRHTTDWLVLTCVPSDVRERGTVCHPVSALLEVSHLINTVPTLPFLLFLGYPCIFPRFSEVVRLSAPLRQGPARGGGAAVWRRVLGVARLAQRGTERPRGSNKGWLAVAFLPHGSSQA